MVVIGKSMQIQYKKVKTYKGIHTCASTFDQKQMSAAWIAKHYEKDIRMNPTWPISAFQKKIVNDWHCQVSTYLMGRAKRMALSIIRGNHVDQ